MTIKQAMDAGITAVRQEPWNQYCRLKLPVFTGKPHGIWAKLIDPCSNPSLGHEPEHGIDILLLESAGVDPQSDEWEPWIEPADYPNFLARLEREKAMTHEISRTVRAE
jgi:hypothetical protein